MTTAPSSDLRNRKLRKLHVLVRQHGLDEETYRAKLFHLTGQRSAADCTDEELDRALGMFHGQTTHLPFVSKIKALFIAAYNLGAFSNGTDAALDAFAERQTGKKRLRFMTPAEANAVTEALKAICRREGFDVPEHADDHGLEARKALLRAQWAKLAAMGVVINGHEAALDMWLSCRIVPHKASHHGLNRHELDAAAVRLGKWIRHELANRASSSPGSEAAGHGKA